MSPFTAIFGAALVMVALPATAQTFTSCNPTNATCPPNVGLNQWSYSVDFTGSEAAALFQQNWTPQTGTKAAFGPRGMVFNVSNSAQAPTIFSNFTFLFGRVDVKMQAAPGTGLVSSIILESQDLDEVDWVSLGGNTTSVETNYYGKGGNSLATYVAADSPQTKAHTYSIEWTSSSLVWSIDGQMVRTLAARDADGGNAFPQTPMALKIGSWDGGKPGGQPGTIAWAGGLTDFSEAPFIMYIESVKITNYNPSQYYQWSDNSGNYSSIKAYNSTASSGNSSDAGSSTASSIVGGPTLVSATASATAQDVATTGSGSSDSGSGDKKNLAGRTSQASPIFGLLSVAFGCVSAVAML